MDDIQELIGKIMSDPNAMSQLESMGRQLGLDIPQNSTKERNTGTNDQNRQREGNEGTSASMPQVNQDLLSGLMNNPQLLSLLGGAVGSPQKDTKKQSGLAKSGSSSLGGDALASVAKLMPLLSSLNSEDDTTRLLESLRPFLGSAKQKKLDEAKKMLRLLKILPLIKSKGIL